MEYRLYRVISRCITSHYVCIMDMCRERERERERKSDRAVKKKKNEDARAGQHIGVEIERDETGGGWFASVEVGGKKKSI